MTREGLAVHHLAVLVADLNRAESFYTGVLGLRILRRWQDEAGRPRSIWLELDRDVFLALELAPDTGPRRGDGAPGWHCVALAIAPGTRESWRLRLQAAGFPPHRESPHTLYVRDPDGNTVALSHYPQQAA